VSKFLQNQKNPTVIPAWLQSKKKLAVSFVQDLTCTGKLSKYKNLLHDKKNQRILILLLCLAINVMVNHLSFLNLRKPRVTESEQRCK